MKDLEYESMANYAYFPLFFSMENKIILIVGGGRVAERRIRSLLDFGAKMTIVSPEITDGIKTLRDNGLIAWIPAGYQTGFLPRPDYVLACTDDRELNHSIALEWKEKGIPVNNASCKEDSDFYFPALIREKGLLFGVSSDGSDHKRVRQVCEKIRKYMKEWETF